MSISTRSSATVLGCLLVSGSLLLIGWGCPGRALVSSKGENLFSGDSRRPDDGVEALAGTYDMSSPRRTSDCSRSGDDVDAPAKEVSRTTRNARGVPATDGDASFRYLRLRPADVSSGRGGNSSAPHSDQRDAASSEAARLEVQFCERTCESARAPDTVSFTPAEDYGWHAETSGARFVSNHQGSRRCIFRWTHLHLEPTEAGVELTRTVRSTDVVALEGPYTCRPSQAESFRDGMSCRGRSRWTGRRTEVHGGDGE